MMTGSGNDWDGQDKRIDFKNDKLVAAYSYKDSSGREVFIKEKWVLSSGDKKFLIKQHDLRPIDERGGEWDDDLKFDPSGMIIGRGTEDQILYHMDIVEKTKKSLDIIYIITEGEKDADTLQKILGNKYVVTTNSDGGGAIRGRTGNDNLIRHFSGHDLVIFHDNDDVGYNHAIDIIELAEELPKGERPKSIRIVELPGLEETEDVSDYIEFLLDSGKNLETGIYDVIRAHGYDSEAWLKTGRAQTTYRKREIEKLSELDEDSYEDIKVEIARKLDMPVSQLDKRVKKANGGGGQLKRLLKIASGWELFIDDEGNEWAYIPDSGRKDTIVLKEKGEQAINRLSDKYLSTYGMVPREEHIKDTIRTLMGNARISGNENRVHIRVAEHVKKENGRIVREIYYDLCDSEGKMIKITRDGWEVVDWAPVRFVRPNGMLPVEVPEKIAEVDTNKAIMQMKRFIVYKRQSDFVLNVCWFLNLFRPDNVQAMLLIPGSEGSAKSSTTRMIRNIFDPNAVDLQMLPKSAEDFMIDCVKRRIIALDNVSSIHDWLSDVIAQIITGGAMTRRTLYLDSEQNIMKAIRPVIINGIGNPVTRSDLMDRGIVLRFDPIPPNRRRPLSGAGGILEVFEQSKGIVFGGLLNLVVNGLRNEGQIAVGDLPRLADLSKWSMECIGKSAFETAFGENIFKQSFSEGSEDNVDDLFESDSVAMCLWELITGVEKVPNVIGNVFDNYNGKGNPSWEATTSELLTYMNLLSGDQRYNKDWPADAIRLGGKIDRIREMFMKRGISILKHKSNGKRSVVFQKIGGKVEPIIGITEKKEWDAWEVDEFPVNFLDARKQVG